MNYEKKMKENIKRNEKYLKEFENWLNKDGLGNKTIKKHLSNADLFINDYLNYHDIIKAEDGLGEVFMFLDDWFIRKCTWSPRNSLKETAASLTKFYQFMYENNYVDIDDFTETFSFIKNNMVDILDHVDEYNNFDEFDEDDCFDIF